MEKFAFKSPNCFSDKDETKLLIVFPAEIWLLILNKISDSEHYHKICATSSYFYKLLLPERPRFLFPEVIKLCSTNILQQFAFSTKKALPSLLQCRAVCKAWKQGVDLTFHQILSQTTPHAADWKSFGNKTCDFSPSQISLLHSFFSARKIKRFMETFHNSHFLTGSNPFPTRSIHLPIPVLPTYQSKYFMKIVEVFQLYGHHIWHCYITIRYCRDADELEQAFEFLRPFLKLLPQLKTLRINQYVHNQEESTERLQNILLANPLPKLKKLELLEERNLAQPVFSHLLQNSPQITKLKIDKLDSNRHRALFTTPLPNLGELQIWNFNSAQDFLYLENVQVQWPLKTLTILCHSDTPHVNNVFAWIESKWAETLTDLSITIPTNVPFAETCSLNLPHLQNLKIKVGQYVCMDFVMPLCKSLVSLNVYYEGRDKFDDNLEKNCQIKFFLHRKNLLKSNIWKYFRRLRELNFAEDSAIELSNVQEYFNVITGNDISRIYSSYTPG